MAGSTPHEAVENFLDPLNLAVAMFTADQLSISAGGRYPRDGEPHVVFLNRGDLSRLSGPDVGLQLILHYRIIPAEGDLGPWKTSCTKYEYSIQRWSDHRELVAFHWHPDDSSPHEWPHVHVMSALLAEDAPVPRQKLTLRTDRVSVEYVLRVCADQFDCGPRDRERWDEVLARSDEVFREFRTWG